MRRRSGISVTEANEPNFLPDFYDEERIRRRAQVAREQLRQGRTIAYTKDEALLKDSRESRASSACLRIHSAFYETTRFFAEREPDRNSDWNRGCVCGLCDAEFTERLTYQTAGDRVWFMDTEVKSIERKHVVPIISEIAMVNASATDVFHYFIFYKELHANYAAISDFVKTTSNGLLSIEKSPWDDRSRSLLFSEAVYLMIRRVPCMSLIISNGLEHDPSAFIENVLHRCSPETTDGLLALMNRKQWKWMPMELLRAGLVRGLSHSDGPEVDAESDEFKARMKAFSLKKSLSSLVEEEFQPEKILGEADRKYNKAARTLRAAMKQTGRLESTTLDDVLDPASAFNTDVQYNTIREALRPQIAAYVRQARLRTEYFQSNLSPLLVSTLDQLFETHYQYRPPFGWIPFQDPSTFDRPMNNPYIAGKLLAGTRTSPTEQSKAVAVLPILRMVHVRYTPTSFASPIALNYHTAEVDVLCKLQVVASWFFGFEAVARCTSLNQDTRRALYEYLVAPTKLDNSVTVQRRLEVFRQKAKVSAANHVKGFAACLLRLSAQASALIYATYYCKVDMLFSTYVTNALARYRATESAWVFNGPFDFPGSIEAKNEVSFVIKWKNADRAERNRRDYMLRADEKAQEEDEAAAEEASASASAQDRTVYNLRSRAVSSAAAASSAAPAAEQSPVRDGDRAYNLRSRSRAAAGVGAGAEMEVDSSIPSRLRRSTLAQRRSIAAAESESRRQRRRIAPGANANPVRVADEDLRVVEKLMQEAFFERDSTGTTVSLEELAKKGKIPEYQYPALMRKEQALMLQRGGASVRAGMIQRIRELPPFAQFMPYWIGSYSGRTTVDRDGLYSIKVHHMWCLHFYANALAELLPSSLEDRRTFANGVIAAREAIRKGRFLGDIDMDFRSLWGAVRTLVEFDNERYAKRIQSGMRWYALLDFGSVMSNFVWCKNCKRYAGEPPRPNNVVMQVFAENEETVRAAEDPSFVANGARQEEQSRLTKLEDLYRIPSRVDPFVFTNPESYAIESSEDIADGEQRRRVYTEFMGAGVYRSRV